MPSPRASWLAALFCALPACAVPATGQEAPFNTFERPSRFSVAWPEGYLFEADPAAALYLWSSTSALRALENQAAASQRSRCLRLDSWLTILLPSGDAAGCTFVVVPHFVIRQMEDSSAAVKPPSFNPYVEWTSYRMAKPRPLRFFRSSPHVGLLTYTRLRLAHYSNGQAGCTYVGDTLQGKDEPCGRSVGVTADVPNTDDGDFSTSYAEPALGLGVFGLKQGQMGWYLILDVAPAFHATQSNLASWAPGSMTRHQLRTYGNRELTGELRAMYWIEPLGAAAQATLLHNVADRRTPGFGRWRSDASVGVTFQTLFGFGVFARRTRGYDYYNIGYGRSVDDRTRLSIEFHPAMGRRRINFDDSPPRDP